MAGETGISMAKNQKGPRAQDRRAELYGLLGKLPPRHRAVSARVVSSEDRGGYTLEKLVIDLNGEEPAPAYFARPKGRSGRLPTVLFNHSHGGGYTIGKQEFIDGREYMGKPPYAEFLTSLGYNALCFDAWIFGSRPPRTSRPASRRSSSTTAIPAASGSRARGSSASRSSWATRTGS
jgi:hypothetical protein